MNKVFDTDQKKLQLRRLARKKSNTELSLIFDCSRASIYEELSRMKIPRDQRNYSSFDIFSRCDIIVNQLGYKNCADYIHNNSALDFKQNVLPKAKEL